MFQQAAEVKARLDVALGDNAKLYWDDLKKVVKDEIGKAEWDARAKRYLGELNVHVHNEFIGTIFKAADAEAHFGTRGLVQPPADSRGIPHPAASSAAASRGKDGAGARQLGRAKGVGLPPVPFSRDAHKVQLVPKGSQASAGAQKTKAAKQQRRRRQLILAQRTGRNLPNTDQILAQMYIGQVESGLKDVDPTAARMLEAAVDTYVKTLVEASIVASGASYSVLPCSRVRYNLERNPKRGAKAKVGLADLQLATEQSPGIIGVDPDTQRAKIMLALAMHS